MMIFAHLEHLPLIYAYLCTQITHDLLSECCKIGYSRWYAPLVLQAHIFMVVAHAHLMWDLFKYRIFSLLGASRL